jgi:hypothetical protein
MFSVRVGSGLAHSAGWRIDSLVSELHADVYVNGKEPIGAPAAIFSIVWLLVGD